MTFLPIVERELRGAARKRSTFWLRVSAALVGLIIGAGFMMLSRLTAFGVSTMGDALFSTLTWLALFAALTAGLFFTADSLSEEKREGTLGFLFLTDLRGYDVVGGKLLVTSLRVTYALMAVIPVLAVTFLLGAVSGAQYWKTALALLNALFCSLAAGLMVSAISRDAQKALGATALLLLLLVLGGPITDGIYCDIHNRAFTPVLSLASAGFAFTQAGAWGRNPYWLALGLSHAIGWTMLALACLLVPRTWQEKTHRPKATRLGYWWRYGGRRRRRALRRKLLDRDPVLWLSCRERWQSVGIWLIALLITGLVASLIIWKGRDDDVWGAWIAASWLFVALLYLWAASQAGRFYLEARRTGLLELLLASPLSVKQVVRGHWRGVLRLFGLPLGLLLLAGLVGDCVAYGVVWGQGGLPSQRLLLSLATSSVSALSRLASLAALAWFGMWMGMTSKNASLATLKSIVFVKIIPFLVTYFAAYIALMWLVMPGAVRRSPGPIGLAPALMTFLMMGVPAALNVLVATGLALWARHRLYARFRDQAARGSGPVRFTGLPVPPPVIPAPPVIPPPPPGAFAASCENRNTGVPVGRARTDAPCRLEETHPV